MVRFHFYDGLDEIRMVCWDQVQFTAFQTG